MAVLSSTEIQSNYLLAVLVMFADECLEENNFEARYACDHRTAAYIVLEDTKFLLSFESLDLIYLSVEFNGNIYHQSLERENYTDLYSYDIWDLCPEVLDMAIKKMEEDNDILIY